MSWKEHKAKFGLKCHKCNKEFIPLATTQESIDRNGKMFDLHIANCKGDE